jgi:hypothetical protein
MKANTIFKLIVVKDTSIEQQANRIKMHGEKKSERLKKHFQLKYADVLEMLRDNFAAQGSY